MGIEDAATGNGRANCEMFGTTAATQHTRFCELAERQPLSRPRDIAAHRVLSAQNWLPRFGVHLYRLMHLGHRPPVGP